MGTPNQHVLSDQPFGELELKSARTTDDIIRRKFVPMLKQLIYGYGFYPVRFYVKYAHMAAP